MLLFYSIVLATARFRNKNNMTVFHGQQNDIKSNVEEATIAVLLHYGNDSCTSPHIVGLIGNEMSELRQVRSTPHARC